MGRHPIRMKQRPTQAREESTAGEPQDEAQRQRARLAHAREAPGGELEAGAQGGELCELGERHRPVVGASRVPGASGSVGALQSGA